MSKAIQAAQKAARKAIERGYTGVATITEYQEVEDPRTHFTDYQEVIVLENQPCKLSFETVTTAIQTETAATISQVVKLFISPDVTINPGGGQDHSNPERGNNGIRFQRCSGCICNASGNYIRIV